MAWGNDWRNGTVTQDTEALCPIVVIMQLGDSGGYATKIGECLDHNRLTGTSSLCAFSRPETMWHLLSANHGSDRGLTRPPPLSGVDFGSHDSRARTTVPGDPCFLLNRKRLAVPHEQQPKQSPSNWLVGCIEFRLVSGPQPITFGRRYQQYRPVLGILQIGRCHESFHQCLWKVAGCNAPYWSGQV